MGRNFPRQIAENHAGRKHAELECFDCGLVLKQNGNPVSNRVDSLALVALQAFLAAQHQRLPAHRAYQDFQQVRREHTKGILAGKPEAGTSQPSIVSSGPLAISSRLLALWVNRQQRRAKS